MNREKHYTTWTNIFAQWNTLQSYKQQSVYIRIQNTFSFLIYIWRFCERQGYSYTNCAERFQYLPTVIVTIIYVLAVPIGTIILDGRPVVDKEVGDNTEYFIESRVLAVTRTSQA